MNKPIPKSVVIEVNAAATVGRQIPRTIFGTFLEPIGDATYNGLWAELLENPSFEAGLWSPDKTDDMLRERPELKASAELALPLPWQPLDSRQGNRYEIHYRNAPNSWQSLRVFGVPGESTGIRQRVYLPIHRTWSYVGSFYAKHLSGQEVLKVEFRMRDRNDILSGQEIRVHDSSWKKYTFALRVPPGRLHPLDPADFVVELRGDERVELDEFSLMPADAIDGLDPDVVAMARAMHTSLVRFGGNFTSSYHWRDGIGPRDKRISMLNNAWGIPEYNTFGTDEFLEFCRLIGAQPQIALNLGSGTAKEAAGWVRYVNRQWGEHAGLLWELGNELWGNWNLGYPTRGQVASRTLSFSRAIRAVDPHARLIATGADPDVFQSWNAIQLRNPPGTFDYLSTHFVVRLQNTVLKQPTPDFVTAAAFALPAELERRVHEEQMQIDHSPGYAGKAHIAFTEWLFYGEHPGTPSFTNMGGAVITGGFLNMLLRSSDVIPVSNMTGVMEFAGISKRRGEVFAAPSYYAFKMYATADVSERVQATEDSGTYSVGQGVGRLPDIAPVPYLDVVAVLGQGGRRLTLFCVNRSLDRDIPAAIHLRSFDPKSTAIVQALSAKHIGDENNEIAPTYVVPHEKTEVIGASGWVHVFPRASVTAISMDRK